MWRSSSTSQPSGTSPVTTRGTHPLEPTCSGLWARMDQMGPSGRRSSRALLSQSSDRSVCLVLHGPCLEFSHHAPTGQTSQSRMQELVASRRQRCIPNCCCGIVRDGPQQYDIVLRCQEVGRPTGSSCARCSPVDADATSLNQVGIVGMPLVSLELSSLK